MRQLTRGRQRRFPMIMETTLLEVELQPIRRRLRAPWTMVQRPMRQDSVKSKVTRPDREVEGSRKGPRNPARRVSDGPAIALVRKMTREEIKSPKTNGAGRERAAAAATVRGTFLEATACLDKARTEGPHMEVARGRTAEPDREARQAGSAMVGEDKVLASARAHDPRVMVQRLGTVRVAGVIITREGQAAGRKAHGGSSRARTDSIGMRVNRIRIESRQIRDLSRHLGVMAGPGVCPLTGRQPQTLPRHPRLLASSWNVPSTRSACWTC